MTGARDQRPVYLTPLIDRKDELAWLEERVMRGERLVTVFGPPGVGKTRLAVEVLDAARTAGIDGYFCELFEARTEEDVATEVLRAMFLGDVPPGTPRDAVVAALVARGPTLVVLDNFEHLTRVALSTLTMWVASCTQTTFIITSREVLRVPGEVARELAPLRVPASSAELAQSPAARLLLESVGRYRKPAPIDAEEEALLCDLVQRLDGLPLALEIVAPSIALMGTRLVHERLERVLSSGERAFTGPARTLRDAIAWSWALLGDEERMTLASCAVFQGGFTIEALEAAVPNEPDTSRILPRLMTLRDKSLVHALPSEGTPRFGTYAAITEFALEQLDLMKRREEAQRRHRAYFARRARQRTTRPGTETLEFMRAERANLMAAVERARADDPTAREDVFAILTLFGPPVFVGERRSRIVALLERAFATFGAGDDLATGYALAAKGQFILYNEDAEPARRDLRRALEIAKAHGDKRLEAQVVTHLQRASTEGREVRLARLADAVSLAREVGDLATQSLALGRMAIIHCNAGDTEPAIEAARASVRTAPDPANEVRARVVSAYVNIACDDFSAAEEDTNVALEKAARHGFNAIEGDAFIARATVLHLVGKLEEADDAYRVAVQRLDEVARDMSAGSIRTFWALLLLERDEPRAALETALRAVSHLDVTLDPMRPPELLNAIVAMARARMAGEEVDASVFHADVLPEVAAVLALLEIASELEAAKRDGAEREQRARLRFEALRAEGAATNRHSVERAVLDNMIERMLRGEHARVSVSERMLVVHASGDWFRMPRGSIVSCKHRQVLRPLLRTLAEARRDHPGEPVSVDVLRRAGWPDERMGEESARNRLKQAMAVLRRLGLGEVLSTGRTGYMLASTMPLRIAE